MFHSTFSTQKAPLVFRVFPHKSPPRPKVAQACFSVYSIQQKVWNCYTTKPCCAVHNYELVCTLCSCHNEVQRNGSVSSRIQNRELIAGTCRLSATVNVIKMLWSGKTMPGISGEICHGTIPISKHGLPAILPHSGREWGLLHWMELQPISTAPT